MKTTKPPRTRTAPAALEGDRDDQRDMAKDGQRIAKLLARAGIASRREIERMIVEGRIALDGKAIDTPATVLASLRGITVDGQPVQEPAPARLFLFHKPAGVLTTERDPKGRPTIYDRLPRGLPRVVPVGRLDYNTEGLLLFTTDGELKRQLELPSTGVERSYRARAFGDVSQDQLEALIEGIEIEGIRYGAIDANLERRTGRNQWIEMKLTEGKNREVRRVLEHLGLEVSRLIRTAYGPFVLADLPVGAVEEVRRHDLIIFRKNLSSGAASARRTGTAPRTKILPSPDAPASEPARTQDERPARRPAAREPERPSGRPAGPRGGARPSRRAEPSPAQPSRSASSGNGPGAPRGSRGAGQQVERPQRSGRGLRAQTGEREDRRPPRSASPRGPRDGAGQAERPQRPGRGPRAEMGEREDRRPAQPGPSGKPGGPGKPRRTRNDTGGDTSGGRSAPGRGGTAGRGQRPGSPRPPRRGPKS